MSEPLDNDRLAKELGIHPAQVSQFVDQFNDSELGRVMKHILRDRINSQIKGKIHTLITVKVEDLKQIQGEISGLEKSLAALE